MQNIAAIGLLALIEQIRKQGEKRVNNREIEAGAKNIAKDLQLPSGRRKKFARLVAKHLAWFDLAEARGMTWDDMIAALAAAGVKRENGLPLSRGTLSSAVWRKRQQASAAPRRNDALSPESSHDRSGRKRSPRLKQSSSERATRQHDEGTRPTTKPAVRRKSTFEGHPAVGGHTREANAPNTVLAYMRRAAHQRRNADETD